MDEGTLPTLRFASQEEEGGEVVTQEAAQRVPASRQSMPPAGPPTASQRLDAALARWGHFGPPGLTHAEKVRMVTALSRGRPYVTASGSLVTPQRPATTSSRNAGLQQQQQQLPVMRGGAGMDSAVSQSSILRPSARPHFPAFSPPFIPSTPDAFPVTKADAFGVGVEGRQQGGSAFLPDRREPSASPQLQRIMSGGGAGASWAAPHPSSISAPVSRTGSPLVTTLSMSPPASQGNTPVPTPFFAVQFRRMGLSDPDEAPRARIPSPAGFGDSKRARITLASPSQFDTKRELCALAAQERAEQGSTPSGGVITGRIGERGMVEDEDDGMDL